jgi:hypothetical protein
MQCADEVVVVINPQPMKAGDSLEEKTEETLCVSHDGRPDRKVWDGAKDGSSFKMIGKYSGNIPKKLEGI